MDDERDIRFVDSHAECVCGDHYHRAVIDKIVLIAPAFIFIKPRVVAGSGESVFLKQFAHFLDRLARRAINYAGFILALFYQLHQLDRFVLRLHDGKEQVRPVEARCDNERGAKLQQIFYIISDGSRGGSGKRADNGTRVKSVDKIGYFQIARAKILTPLRDAVRLVDRDHGYIEIAAYSEKSGRAEPLRCDINYFIFAALRVLQHFQILRVGQ